MEEVTQVFKKQKLDEDFILATELNIKSESQILDAMEIKIEQIKIEPSFFVPEHNGSLDQQSKLFEEAKVIADNDEQMIDCSAVENSQASIIENIFELKDSGRLTDEKRLEFKRNGRPTSDINLKQKVKCRKEVTLHFKSSMYDLCDWICGCPVRKALYCFPCILMCEFSKDKCLWTKIGVTNLKHLREKINRHAVSPLHLSNALGWACLGRVDIGTRLDCAYRTSIKEYNEKVTHNRYVLNKIIDCVKFCDSFERASKGGDEVESSKHPGMTYARIVDFAAELDGIFNEHLEKNKMFKGVSRSIRNDLLDSIEAVTQELIRAEVQRANFVSIQVDEVTDTTNKNQLVFIVRYVLDGNIQERFWKFIEPRDATTQALSDEILNELDALKIGENPEKLIAQCYDGANIVDVQMRVEEKYPAAHFVHCYAHHLKLILQKAASQHKKVRVFFASLEGFSSFFGMLPRRILMLDKVVRKRASSESGPTRWDFNTRCIETVYNYRSDLITCLEEVLTIEVDSDTLNEASTLKMFLENEEFLYWLNFFHFVMPHVDELYSRLQKANIDTSAIDEHIKDFNVTIENIRDHGITFTNDVNGTNETIKTEDDSRRIVSAEICDIIMSEIGSRFESTNHLVISRLFSRKKSDDILNVAKITHPSINNSKLKSELLALYKRKEFCNGVSAVALLQLLLDMNLQEAFSESVKLLDMLCTIPMATVEGERCFPTLKSIKNFWRNTMGESRRTAYAMLSIEKPLIRSAHNFNELVIDHFARRNERRVNLLYNRF